MFDIILLYIALAVIQSSGDTTPKSVEMWGTEPPKWYLDNYKLLQEDLDVHANQTVSLDDIIKNSDKFPINFPIETVRCQSLKSTITSDNLQRNINSAYPIVHERALFLYALFISHKKRFGTPSEREIYQNLTLPEFIDRLLKKRAVVFLGPSDKYILLDGTSNFGKWETVGTPDEQSPLILKNCISYDEIKLSAFLSVSSFTHFINIGDRHNSGKVEVNRSKIEDEGVIIGLIGPRLEKPLVMEYRDVIISKEQNDHRLGYGQFFIPTLQGLFLNFYGEVSLSFPEILPKMQQNPKNYIKLDEDIYFNNAVYENRISLSFDTLLIEANERAKEQKKMGYVHVVGIGLGVWKIAPHQNKLFMDTFIKRIVFLANNLNHVSDICFSYINSTSSPYKDKDIIPIENHPSNGIKIHILNREPHSKLTGEDEGKFLIVSYAWDGNAMPGNEFWTGSLAGSGDPAAASSTQIAEIHNPHINLNVAGINLRVVTLNDGLMTFKQYQEHVKRIVESESEQK